MRLFLAALRAALLAALAYIRGAFARTEDAAGPASVSASLKDSNPGPAVRGIRPSRERAAYPSFAGASTDPDALAAAALDAHEAFVRDAVFPEALRYAKQLRYDGYKIVLVTAAPAEALKPLGRAMGASRVIGAEAGSDLATTPDGLAFTGDVRATSALRADRTGCVGRHRRPPHLFGRGEGAAGRARSRRRWACRWRTASRTGERAAGARRSCGASGRRTP